MTSTTIYSHTATDRTPYTYLIGWTQHDKWYYGRRTAKGCHPDDLWVKYFTSSKYVERFRKEHGEPDVIQIRRLFNDIEKCQKWEDKVLSRLNASRHIKFLNAKNSASAWDATNKSAAVCQITGNSLGLIALDDPRWLTGEINGVQFNTVQVRSEAGSLKSYHIKNLTPDILGHITMHNKTTNKLERITVKHFIDNTDNFITSRNYNSTKQSLVNAVLCKDIRTGNAYMVERDVFESTEWLVGVNTGNKLPRVKQTSDRTRKQTSARFKGMVAAKDTVTDSFVSITKEEFVNNDRYVGATTGLFPAKDREGNLYYISNTDERYLSGLLVHRKSKKFLK